MFALFMGASGLTLVELLYYFFLYPLRSKFGHKWNEKGGAKNIECLNIKFYPALPVHWVN